MIAITTTTLLSIFAMYCDAVPISNSSCPDDTTPHRTEISVLQKTGECPDDLLLCDYGFAVVVKRDGEIVASIPVKNANEASALAIASSALWRPATDLAKDLKAWESRK